MSTRLTIICAVVIGTLTLEPMVRAAAVSLDPPSAPVAVTTTSLRASVAFDPSAVTAPATATLAFTVTNTGAIPAPDVLIDNLLPIEFQFVHGVPAELANLGSLAPGQSVTKSYQVVIPSTVATNRYVDEAIISAANTDRIEATAGLDVSNGQVLGANDTTVTLAETGRSPWPVFLAGIGLLIVGGYSFRRRFQV